MSVEVIYPADRTAWLQARKQDVTASVAGCLLGVHPYTTAYQLWAEKTGAVDQIDDESDAMRRGRLLEPVAIQLLREDRPDWAVIYHQDNAYYRDPDGRIGATPDAFATRPDLAGRGIVQIKTAHEDIFRSDWLDAETREVVLPLWIAVQAIVEADLTDSTWACVAVLVIGRGLELYVVDVPIHAGVKARVRSSIKEFWTIVDAGGQPKIEWERDGSTVLNVFKDSMPDIADLTSNDVLDKMIDRYQSAKQRERDAKAEADLLRPQIIYEMGNAERGETRGFVIKAPTTFIPEQRRRASQTRRLKITRKENADGNF